jgi:HEPN domain-containing protein
MNNDAESKEKILKPVFAWDYFGLPKSDHWFLMAKAFLDCSRHLFKEMKEDKFDRNYHRAKASAFLMIQALELLFKGSIVHAKASLQTHHRLNGLYNQFKNLYPGKDFYFSARVDDIIRQNNMLLASEYTRYPADKKGKLWLKSDYYDITTWSEEADLLADDFHRIEKLIKKKYNNNR